MIFGSFGLLVVAVILLIAAVVKSSVALGVGSLICTLLATVLLVAANAYYKKLTLDAEHSESGDSKLRRLATEGGASSAQAPAGSMVQGNGHIVTTAGAAPVIVAARPATVPNGYELLNATQAAALADTLNLDELHEVRRFEVEHEMRQTVLGAVDRRIQAIVAVRKQVASTES